MTNKYVRRIIKTVLWIFVGILGLIILAVAALQFHPVQRYILQKAVFSISEKTHTRIEIGSVEIAFTHSIVLQNIFIESRQQDTLLFIQTLAADVNLLGLFSHEIKLTNVRIDSLTAHITRTSPDNSYNFDFILHALSPNSTTAENHPESSAAPGWKIQFGGLTLNGIRGTYDDEVNGLNIRLQLGALKASIDKFDFAKEHYYIDELSLANTTASALQTKKSPTDESTSAGIDFGLGLLSLSKIYLKYENTIHRRTVF